MRTLLFLPALLAGCGGFEAHSDVPPEVFESLQMNESPEALGVLAFLNHPATTVAVLDNDVGLTGRASRNLVDHRNGADGEAGTDDDDRFDSIDEVDAVPQVGDGSLEAILAYALDNGWVNSEETYGIIEGVEFSNEQAAAVVDLVNTAPLAVLDDDVDLDARAAANIVEQRPFENVEAIAEVSYVGSSGLEKLRDFVASAEPNEGLSADEAVAKLTAASADLWYVSESDYPLTVFQIEAPGPINAATAKSILEPFHVDEYNDVAWADRYVEQSTVEAIFDHYTEPEDWWEDDQRDEAAQWQQVRDVFERDLNNSTVFRIGEEDSGWVVGEINLFVVGYTVDGDLVGFQTLSIET